MVPVMSRPVESLDVDSAQRSELEHIVKSPTSPQRMVLRARMILERGRGRSHEQIARSVGVGRRIVGKWCGRFRRMGMAGLQDAKGRGRPGHIPEAVKQRVIVEAVRPPAGRARWSVQAMAAHAGVSVGTVHALWQANDIKPHLTRTFKVSNDRQFEVKFWDVIGLYLDPPHKALVFCCDEKSRCQALERTQPGLPLGLGHIRTKTHDYIRHGTITLFAALNCLDGKIISRTAPRHTRRQWLDFLKQLDRETPPEATLHLIVDNYATHKHAVVKRWLAKHPRFHMHFTPTSSSWMNLVERFFRDLTVDVVREGSFGSVQELVDQITHYLGARNLAPRRYVWKAKGEAILAKIKRARSSLASVQGAEL
jgi:transposase